MKNQAFIQFISDLIDMLIKAGAETVKTSDEYAVMYRSFIVTLAYRRFNLQFLGTDVHGMTNGNMNWPYYLVDINGVKYNFEPNEIVPQQTIDNIALKIDRLADDLFLKPNQNEGIFEAVVAASKQQKQQLSRETYLIKKNLVALYREQTFKNAQYKIDYNRRAGRVYAELLKFKNQLPHSLKLRNHPFIKVRKLLGKSEYYEVTFDNGKFRETFLDNRNVYAAIQKAESGLREILTSYGHDRYMVNVLKEYPNLFNLDVEVLKNIDTLSTIK